MCFGEKKDVATWRNALTLMKWQSQQHFSARAEAGKNAGCAKWIALASSKDLMTEPAPQASVLSSHP